MSDNARSAVEVVCITLLIIIFAGAPDIQDKIIGLDVCEIKSAEGEK